MRDAAGLTPLSTRLPVARAADDVILLTPHELEVQGELGSLPWWMPYTTASEFVKDPNAPVGLFALCPTTSEATSLNDTRLTVSVRAATGWRTFSLVRVPAPNGSLAVQYRLTSDDGFEPMECNDSRILLVLLDLQFKLGFRLLADLNSEFSAMAAVVLSHSSWLGNATRQEAETALKTAPGHFIVREAQLPGCAKVTQSAADANTYHLVAPLDLPHRYIVNLKKREQARAALRGAMETPPDGDINSANTPTPGDKFDTEPWWRPNLTRGAVEQQLLDWAKQPNVNRAALFVVRNAPAGCLALATLDTDGVSVRHRVIRVAADVYECENVTARTLRELLVAFALSPDTLPVSAPVETASDPPTLRSSALTASATNLHTPQRVLTRKPKGAVLPTIAVSNVKVAAAASPAEQAATTTLLNACANGDIVEVGRQLAAKVANKNAVDSQGFSVLLLAAVAGHVNICSLLVDHGADVTAVGDSGSNVLHYLAGQVDETAPSLALVKRLLVMDSAIVSMLLKPNSSGESPLHRAAGVGRVDIMRALLEAAKKSSVSVVEFIDHRNKNGWPPIAFAARAGQTEAVVLLVEHGASLDPVGVEHELRRLSDVALLGGSVELSEYLVEHQQGRLTSSTGSMDKPTGSSKKKEGALARLKKAFRPSGSLVGSVEQRDAAVAAATSSSPSNSGREDDGHSPRGGDVLSAPASPAPVRLSLRTCSRCNSPEVRARARLENGQQRWLCAPCAIELGSMPPPNRGMHRVRSFVNAREAVVLGGNPWHDSELPPVTRASFLASVDGDDDEPPRGYLDAMAKAQQVDAALQPRAGKPEKILALLTALVGERAAAGIATNEALMVKERSECAADMSHWPVGTYAVTVDAETVEPLLFWVAPQTQQDVTASGGVKTTDAKTGVVLHAPLKFTDAGVQLAGSTLSYKSLSEFERAFADALREPLPQAKVARSNRPMPDLCELLVLAVRVKLSMLQMACGERRSAAQQLDTLLGDWHVEDDRLLEKRHSLAPLPTAVAEVARVTTLFYWRAHCAATGTDDERVARLRRAVGAVTRAIVTLKPAESAEMFNFRGLCLAELSETDRAIADLQRALELNPLEPVFAQNLDEVKATLAMTGFERMLNEAADDISLPDSSDDISDSRSPRAPAPVASSTTRPTAVEANRVVTAVAVSGSASRADSGSGKRHTRRGRRSTEHGSINSALDAAQWASSVIDKQAASQLSALSDNLDEDAIFDLLSKSLQRVSESQHSPEIVRDFVVLFRALRMRDEKRGAPFVLHSVVARRITDAQLLTMGNAQMLRMLLEYLPDAGENAIDAMVTRLHKLCDATAAFERAFDDAVELLTDAQVNTLFKSLKFVDIQWFLSFVSKRTAHKTIESLKSTASLRFAVTQDRSALLDKRTQTVVSLLRSYSAASLAQSTTSSAVAQQGSTTEDYASAVAASQSLQVLHNDEQLQLSASFLAAWLNEYAVPDDAQHAASHALLIREYEPILESNGSSTSVTVPAEYSHGPPEKTVASSATVAGTPASPFTDSGTMPFETYRTPHTPAELPQSASSGSLGSAVDSVNRTPQRTDYVAIAADESEASTADSTAMLSGDAAVRNAFQTKLEVASFAFVIPPGELIRRRKIGEGAFGVVYAGRWRHIDVAIKEIKFENEAQLQEFKAEAHKMQSLRPHANIVAFYGIAHEPRFSIVTRFCPGGALDRRLYARAERDRPLTPALAHNLARGIAFGIAHLHHEGIIHRDISARNVLLSSSLEALLTDFGLARTERESPASNLVGAIRWMAPEQLRRGARPSTASDMYSFGVLLYELLARRRPWHDMEASDVQKAVLAGRKLAPPANSLPPLASIMEQCLAASSKERPTADDVATLLAEPMPELYSAVEWAWVQKPATSMAADSASLDQPQRVGSRPLLTIPAVVVDNANNAVDDEHMTTAEDLTPLLSARDSDDGGSSSDSDDGKRLTRSSSAGKGRRSRSERQRAKSDLSRIDTPVADEQRIVSLDMRYLAAVENAERRDERFYRCNRAGSAIRSSPLPSSSSIEWTLRVPNVSLNKPYRVAAMMQTRIPIAVRCRQDADVSLRLLVGKTKLEKGRMWRVVGHPVRSETQTTFFVALMGMKPKELVRAIGIVDGKLQRESLLLKVLPARPGSAHRNSDHVDDSEASDSEDSSGKVTLTPTDEEKATPSARRKKSGSSAPPVAAPTLSGASPATLSAPLPALQTPPNAAAAFSARHKRHSKKGHHRDSGNVPTSLTSSAAAVLPPTTSNCRACGQEISEKEVALLIGSAKVHGRCFVCDACGDKLSIDQFSPSGKVGVCAKADCRTKLAASHQS